MIKRFGISVVCLCALSSFCFAQANPFNGNWKAEPSSLHFTGATFSVATDADGFTVTRGGEASPKVVCDGKPHKSDQSMLTCTKSGSGYSITETRNGKPMRTTSITISADGKTRTSTSKVTPPDGAPFTMTNVAERVSGGPGASGEWKEVKFSSSDDNGILGIEVKGNTIEFKETDSPKPIACKLDGSETAFPGGGSMSVKLADPHTLKVTYKDEKGKVRRENTFALSSDMKSIMETDITPAPSPSKMTITLHKMM